jgi:hypothetical protein
MEFFHNKVIEHMACPAMSPDMNPIKNLWSEISRELNKLDYPPTHVTELTQAVVDCWLAIPDQKLPKLMSSIARRVRVLYNVRVGYTNH